jgi:hypothetical protein
MITLLKTVAYHDGQNEPGATGTPGIISSFIFTKYNP